MKRHWTRETELKDQKFCMIELTDYQAAHEWALKTWTWMNSFSCKKNYEWVKNHSIQYMKKCEECNVCFFFKNDMLKMQNHSFIETVTEFSYEYHVLF